MVFSAKDVLACVDSISMFLLGLWHFITNISIMISFYCYRIQTVFVSCCCFSGYSRFMIELT